MRQKSRSVVVWLIISCSSSEIMSDRLVSRRSLPVPLLTRVFLIYQQLSSLSRPFPRRTLFPGKIYEMVLCTVPF